MAQPNGSVVKPAGAARAICASPLRHLVAKAQVVLRGGARRSKPYGLADADVEELIAPRDW
jgi:hypothetical protein